MATLKINNSDNYEYINITIDEVKHPIAFKNRVDSLIQSGMSEADAIAEAREPIEMELYYDVDTSLIMADSGAVDSGIIFNPYTAERFSDDDIQTRRFTQIEMMQIIQTFEYEVRLSHSGVKIVDTLKNDNVVLSGNINEIESVLWEFTKSLWDNISEEEASEYDNGIEYFIKRLNAYVELTT